MWIRGVTPRWPSPLNVLKAVQDMLEFTPCPCIVRVPRLRETGVCLPELYDEREYPYAIYDHGKGVLLGHNLLSMQ